MVGAKNCADALALLFVAAAQPSVDDGRIV
jgi:hypothetical protein